MTADDPVALGGVPETMLWTLHNRASEAARPDAFLRDDDAVRIYRSIPYDYRRSFGKPDGSHAARSRIFDDALRPWLASHPGAAVVELGAGLETQFRRVDNGSVRWLCVDVPEAIAVRERFLPPTDRCRHLAVSALDPAWIDAVDASRPVFVTAQGLFMYFEESDVARLIGAIATRLAGAELMFDAIPPWFSRKTLRGTNKTPHYQVPPMPWGVNRNEIEPLLRIWAPNIASVAQVPFGYQRGLAGALLPVISRTPGLRNLLPTIARVRTAATQ